MGVVCCSTTSKSNLLLEIERGNNEQRAYGLMLIKNFKSAHKLSFRQTDEANVYRVTLELEDSKHIIEDKFDDSTGKMQESLDKIYKLLK